LLCFKWRDAEGLCFSSASILECILLTRAFGIVAFCGLEPALYQTNPCTREEGLRSAVTSEVSSVKHVAVRLDA